LLASPAISSGEEPTNTSSSRPTNATAVSAAYPHADITRITGILPDAVVGAWERLAECLRLDPLKCSGADKEQWGKDISPHLDFDTPVSPSLNAFKTGIERFLR
jgi:hypothetical protein